MNEEERHKIISNEYADFIVNEFMLSNFENINSDITVNKINHEYSVIHIPLTYMTENVIFQYGYDTIPKCYGLMSNCLDSFDDIIFMEQEEVQRLSGKGILIGFVDTGIDYRNKVFLNDNQTTRIAAIWDQTIESSKGCPKGYYYGTEYKREQINAALLNSNPLSIVPSIDEIGHGTLLAGIAGGSNYAQNGFMGVAANAEFVVVKLKPAKPYLKDFFLIPKDILCYQENDIMLGINYLVQTARELMRPIVICLGLGSSQGAHISEGVINDYLSETGELTNIAITVAAGNEGLSGHHYYGEVHPEAKYGDVLLSVRDNHPGFFMEFWGNAPNLFRIDIYSPGDILIGSISPFFLKQSSITLKHGNTLISAEISIQNLFGGDQFIFFRIKNPKGGIWRFRVSIVDNLSSYFNFWLPINEFIGEGTYFIDSSPYMTLTTPSNEKSIISVTAYDPSNQELYYYSSRGFTKDNKPKPDITAPGFNMLGPVPDNQYVIASGTSIAAAYTAGVIAQFLEWGVISNNLDLLSGNHVKSFLASGAIRTPDETYPNPNWGYGILNIDNTIRLAIKMQNHKLN